MEMCCPSYPNFVKADFNASCAKDCSKDADKYCCVTNCYLKTMTGLNADGSINGANVVSAFVKRSKLGDKYKPTAQKAVDQCVNGKKPKFSLKLF